jgi:DNA polymerase (family 10)
MTNDQLAAPLYLTAALLELAGENPFKARAYERAADAVVNANDYLADRMLAGKAEAIEGVGESSRTALLKIAETGSFELLEQLRTQVPAGIIELSKVKGLGPKKVQQLWREQGIDSPEALLSAIHSGALSTVKGFGAKSLGSLKAATEFLMSQRGLLRLDMAEAQQAQLAEWLLGVPGVSEVHVAGEASRALPVVSALDIVVVTESVEAALLNTLDSLDTAPLALRDGDREGAQVLTQTADGTPVRIQFCSSADLPFTLLQAIGPASLVGHLSAAPQEVKQRFAVANGATAVPLSTRDQPDIIALSGAGFAELLSPADLRGPLHAHSTWSDGLGTLREMAEAARELGYDYLGITDHSRTAAYAGGLSIERVAAQHREIEALNAELAPFRIFKGIESDILVDGSLDYPDEVLATFDFVIASIHSQFPKDEATATARLVRAIQNPYTTIMGHLSGRLLLSRPGYPVDHEAIIEACAAKGVAIEINADPHRLDLDWTWARRAQELDVRLAICPDAHRSGAYAYMRYGVLIGQKGLLTKANTLNALSTDALAAYFARRKVKA